DLTGGQGIQLADQWQSDGRKQSRGTKQQRQRRNTSSHIGFFDGPEDRVSFSQINLDVSNKLSTRAKRLLVVGGQKPRRWAALRLGPWRSRLPAGRRDPIR